MSNIRTDRSRPMHDAAEQQDAQSSPHHPAAAGSDETGPFGEAARATAEAVRAVSRKASAAMTEVGEEARQTSARGGAHVARYVGAHPVISIAIAASVGVFAGLLLARRYSLQARP